MAATPGSVIDELSCPICYELFVDQHTPKSLSCGHVLCKVCLKKMIAGKCQKTCPECRKVIKIPYDGIAAFTTIYRLRSLAENHQIVGSKLPKVSPKKSGACICPDHEDEKMHYYCVTCNTFACQACLILKHNGTAHNIECVKEMCKQQKVEMHSATIRGKSKITAVEGTLDELKMAEIQRIEFYKNLEKQIDECAESQMNKLLTETEHLKRQVEWVKQMNIADLKKETATVQKHMNSAKQSYQAVVSATENLSDHEYISQHTILINKMREIQISEPTTIASKTKPDVIKFEPNSLQIKLGQIFSVTHGTKVRTPTKIQTLYGFSNASSVDCSPDGLLVIADFDGEKVAIYHKINDKYEKKLDLELVRTNRYKPSGIAICRDGRFMVARHTCIEVYSPDGFYQNDITIMGSEKVHVHRVNVTSHGRIVVGDYNRSLLMGINPKGIVTGTIHTSIKPDNMILIHDTHVAISDDVAGKVIVIDIESGQKTLSIDITEVRGICYDELTGCLLIARSEPGNEPGMVRANTGVIEQYSYTTGKLIACLQQELYHPKGMALTCDGHLIVVNERTVGVYDIQ